MGPMSIFPIVAMRVVPRTGAEADLQSKDSLV